MAGDPDIFNVDFGQAMEQINTIKDYHKKFSDQHDMIRSAVGAVTDAEFAGASADSFNQYMASTYLPQIARLVAAIAGLGGNWTSAFDSAQQLEGQLSGIVEGAIGGFSF